MIVFGGSLRIAGGNDAGPVDGAAYDPAANRWRRLRSMPTPDVARIVATPFTKTVWTGRRLLAWQYWDVPSNDPDAPPSASGIRLLSYSPASNRWRVVESRNRGPRSMYAPIWTGDEVIVPPASWWDPRPGFHGFEPGAIYVPRTNRWRELPTSPLNDASGPAVWTGRALVVVNSTTTDVSGILPGSSAAFDVQAGRWYRLQRPVNGFVGGEEQGVRTGRELLIPDATDLIRDGAQTFLLEQGGLRLGP